MTREQCEKKIENIRKNTTRNGIFINEIFFFFNEWDVEILQHGILVHNNEQRITGYRSFYIPFDNVIEIK